MIGKIFTICALLAISEAIRYKVDEYGNEYISAPKKKSKDEQDFSKIKGIPGYDYPIYHEFPPTNFDCAQMPAHPGFYANVDTGCQGYHVCNDGRDGKEGTKFLCTNGTIFSQKEFTCDHWFNVDCGASSHYYALNADPETNPYTKDAIKKEREQAALDAYHSHY